MKYEKLNIKVPIMIDGFKLHKSKYDDVNIIKYTPAEEHPENKCIAIVDFVVRKLIWGDTKEQIGTLINKELENNAGDL